MVKITVTVDCPSWLVQGVKEALAEYLEAFGDTKVVSIEEERPEQMKLEI